MCPRYAMQIAKVYVINEKAICLVKNDLRTAKLLLNALILNSAQ